MPKGNPVIAKLIWTQLGPIPLNVVYHLKKLNNAQLFNDLYVILLDHLHKRIAPLDQNLVNLIKVCGKATMRTDRMIEADLL